MKKFLFFLFLIFLPFKFAFSFSYGIFGDGNAKRDTVYIEFCTYDTTFLSYADCDTYFVRRYFHKSLIDSTFGTSQTNKVRTGFYSVPKKAFDGTNYGQYTVEIEVRKQGKSSKISRFYTVAKNSFLDSGEKVDSLLEFKRNRKEIYVKPNGNDTNSGLSWASAKQTARGAKYACLNAEEYFIYFAPGYYSSQSCTINVHNTHWIGSGEGRTILKGVSGKPVFMVDSLNLVKGTEIANFTITGADTNSGSYGVWVQKGDGFDIHNCRIDTTQKGVNLSSNAKKGRVYNNSIYYFSWDGIFISGTQNLIYDNFINMDTTCYENMDALSISSYAKSNIIYNNKILSQKIGIGLPSITDNKNNLICDNFVVSKIDSAYENPQNNFNFYAGNNEPSKISFFNSFQKDIFSSPQRTWEYQSRTLTSGAGTGTNQVNIVCKQSSDSTELEGVLVQVLNNNQTSTLGLLTTDSDGKAVFSLNSGEYKVRLHKQGWLFTVPESLSVSGSDTVEYFGTPFDPGNPPTPSLCRVYGWVKDVNNNPLVSVNVKMEIKTRPLKYQSVVISPYQVFCQTDSSGYWYLDVFPNTVLTPSNTVYKITLDDSPGVLVSKEVIVPNQSSWELSW